VIECQAPRLKEIGFRRRTTVARIAEDASSRDSGQSALCIDLEDSLRGDIGK
jgi:hypothetical protein